MDYLQKKESEKVDNIPQTKVALSRISQKDLSHEQKMIVMKKAQAMLNKGKK